MARRLAVWFHRSFGTDRHFRAGQFIPPPNPDDAESDLVRELEELREELSWSRDRANQAVARARNETEQREQAEEEARKAYSKLAVAMDLKEETEERMTLAMEAATTELMRKQAESKAASSDEINCRIEQAQQAAVDLDFTEADARKLIDGQLRDAGWEADTLQRSFAGGARPREGLNQAIAEWPTPNGPADYVLFKGLTALAIIEAKPRYKDLPVAIDQARGYSRHYHPVEATEQPAIGSPWGDCAIPFLFAANGRGYLRQNLTRSGIWFHDIRHSSHHPAPLKDWYEPEALMEVLSSP
jgi:type I restriction enzyme R subunit